MATKLTFALHATREMQRFVAPKPLFLLTGQRRMPVRITRCSISDLWHRVSLALHATFLQREPQRFALRCKPLS